MGWGGYKRVKRRLAAILAADVAGYSRLMGRDEERTHARIKANLREVIEPRVREHGGRIVKTTGDGVLAEFQSVVDAVRCGFDMQRAMIDRNEGIAAEQRVDYRIGINLGDIIIDEHDIYGDGVNVAARLEGLAEPGGLCISREVRNQVRDKLPIPLEDIGTHTVKNIARPVHVFALRAATIAGLPPLPRVEAAPDRRRLWTAAAVVLVLVAGGTVAAWWSRPGTDAPSSAALGPPSPVVALAPPVAPVPAAPPADEVVWNVIKDGAAPDPFEAFLKNYPGSPYADAARARLAVLAASAPLPPPTPTPPIEGMIWAMIKDSGSPTTFNEYLQTFPTGAHAAAARARLVALAERASASPPAPPTPAIEGMIWSLIKDGGSAGPIEEYLQAYPNGEHAAAARARLAELSRAAPTPPAAAPTNNSAADRLSLRTQIAPSTPPASLGLDGRWTGDAPATPHCAAARLQFQVTGNRISGTGASGAYGATSYSTTVSGTIGPDGVGRIEWGRDSAKGKIEFSGDRFEARVAVCEARVFAGSRDQ